VFSTLAPLFLRPDMHEFSHLAINLTSANFLSNPERLSRVLLFIASRVAQHDRTAYSYLIRTLASSLTVHAHSPSLLRGIAPFATVVDFEPAASAAALADAMRSALLHLARLLRGGPAQYCSFEFVHLLRLWAPLAFRAPRTADALTQIARRALTADRSLRLNPFRLRVVSVLHEHGADLPCVAPLARIVEKALHERADGDAPFDWEAVLVAERDVARSAAYQERLFDAASEGLALCMRALARRVAFPEIAAPVVRCLRAVADNPVAGERAAVAQRLLARIERTAAWVERQREAAAAADGFDVTETVEIAGEPPFDR
jgi:hypothetical protein